MQVDPLSSLIPFGNMSNEQPSIHVISSITRTVSIDDLNFDISDMQSFDYNGARDHALATSHGTYLGGPNEGLEYLRKY